jgi:deoxyribonuclease IV
LKNPSGSIYQVFSTGRIILLTVGVHVSIAGGIYNSVRKAADLGCNTMQIFPRNPRSFKRKVHSKEDLDQFRLLRKKTGINPLVVHGVYTQNLSSSSRKFKSLSIKSLIDDLKFSKILGGNLLVTHLGSFKGTSLNQGIKNAVYSVNKILDNLPDGITLLLENLAGSGRWLGSKISTLGEIVGQIKNRQNLGICLDTCHLFTAGYNIGTEDGLEEVISELSSTLGWDMVRLVHLNDSVYDLGSLKDRHSHIGKGKIGALGLKRIINHPKFRHLPFILETPKDEADDDKKNLDIVRSMYEHHL